MSRDVARAAKGRSRFKEMFEPIMWLYVWLPLCGLAIGGVFLFYRVSGDLEVCQLYYPEMSRMACYMSTKTVRVPNGR